MAHLLKLIKPLLVCLATLYASSICGQHPHEILDSKYLEDPIREYLNKADFKLIDGSGYLTVHFYYIHGSDEDPTTNLLYQPYEFRLDSCIYIISAFHHDLIPKKVPPLSYTIIDEIPVLFYTGLERLVQTPIDKKILKAIRKFCSEDDFSSKTPEEWFVRIKKNTVEIKKGFNFSPPH